MTSAINTSGIDGDYPIHGRDNDSQGFRDNFTNTKTNLDTAKTEITDLNNKAILKGALTGGTLDNDMAGNIISNVVFKKEARTKYNFSSSQTGNVSINYTNGGYQTLTTSGPVTLTFSDWPSTGKYAELNVLVNVAATAHTVTLPAQVTKKIGTIAGLATRVFTAPTTGEYLFKFTTDDNGSNVVVEVLPITTI